jgi:hypothetical protein
VTALLSFQPRHDRSRRDLAGPTAQDLLASQAIVGDHSGFDVVGAVVKVMGELFGQATSSGVGQVLNSAWYS